MSGNGLDGIWQSMSAEGISQAVYDLFSCSGLDRFRGFSPCHQLTPMASPTNDTQLPRHGHILPTLFKPVTIAFPTFSALHHQQRPLLSHGWRVLLVLHFQQQKSYISFCTLMVVVRLNLPMIELTWPLLSKAHT